MRLKCCRSRVANGRSGGSRRLRGPPRCPDLVDPGAYFALARFVEHALEFQEQQDFIPIEISHWHILRLRSLDRVAEGLSRLGIARPP